MPVDERVARSVALEQAYVHDVYEQFYDNPRSKPWPKVQQFLEDLEPGSLVCDVGCGNGKYLNVNGSIFNIGGDKSMRLTEVAREKENEVLVLDNLALPFRDESLDAALSIAVVHHLATTERRICALRELARVLRIGGRLIISVWAMEQSHRKFESQDVLVPWHRTKHLSTPSLELTSTTNTSEDDIFPPYHAYTQTSDSDSNHSLKSRLVRKRGKTRKGRSIDPTRSSSPSSSNLSSPNETCYSFVRRAIQKLAGGRRVGVHRPWFLDSWGACANKEPQRYDHDGCECGDCTENVHDLPIELRRVDDDDLPQRRQTFPSSQLINEIINLKSKSMSNIRNVRAAEGADVAVSIPEISVTVEAAASEPAKASKPRLVKQKKSICEDDEEEALDQPTDMKSPLNNLVPADVRMGRYQRGAVFKQRSLNEELMSTDRLKEKEWVRKNIQKQASLNEDLMYNQRHAFDTFKDSFFSVSTSKRFQLIKTGFTNKLKSSATIEKVTSTTLKNGFVRMFQNWKSSEMISPTIHENEMLDSVAKPVVEEKKEAPTERRSSKEDGSDSSKDSSLQSDTSVDSEDSFASVIFVPKSDPLSPTPLSPLSKSQSVPNSPRIKQSSCPTSPRIKQMPLTVYPLTKQLSSPKPSTNTPPAEIPTRKIVIKSQMKLAEKYSVPQIPKFRKNSRNSTDATSDQTDKETKQNDRLAKIKDLLAPNSARSQFPIVRQSSVANGKLEAVAKPLPKLLALELFNPETDDKDSDSSCVSSPESFDVRKKFRFPAQMSLIEAAADVAHSLDRTVDKVIKASPRKKCLSDTTPLLQPPAWDEECHQHLSDFADKLSEKLLAEIDEYQEKSKERVQMALDGNLDDPYISRLSEELDDLSKLSAEIQKQNEYLAKLSASDSIFTHCIKCGDEVAVCRCTIGRKRRAKCDVRGAKKAGANSAQKLHAATNDSTNDYVKMGENCDSSGSTAKLGVGKASIRLGTSTDSCDSDKGSSTNSMISSVATSLNFGPSLESADGCDNSHKDTNSISRCSDGGGSTASLASCPEWKTMNNSKARMTNSTVSLESDSSSRNNKKSMLSDTSQDSLPSDNIGGEITYHRYYHVFREGELDQLIEKYVENLHIISSYYDHASWCIIAEKVQVWTI